MSEGAGDLDDAGLGLGDGPSVVSDHMVVAAEWGQVVDFGGSVLGPGEVVVDVALDRSHGTGRPDTFWVFCLDLSFLSCSRLPAR